MRRIDVTLNRRRSLGAAAATIGLLAAAACGGPAPGSSATQGEEPSGEIRLLTPIFEKADGEQLLTKLLGEFTAKYPKVNVSVDHTEYAKLNEKLTTSLASGRPYDVMMMGVGWVPPFAAKGVLADLGENQDMLAQTYHKRVVDPGVWQGRVYALPVMLDMRIGIYRKDIFAEAGISGPPRSFDELRADARKLTNRDGNGNLARAGIDILTVDPRQAFETLLWANGGELFSQDGKVAFNSAAGVGALQLMTDVIRTDKAEDVGFSQPTAPAGIPLLQGRAAMMIGHNNVWTELTKSAPDLIKDDKVGTFLIANTRPAMFQGGTLATVSARTQHPAAAKALTRFLASPEVSLQASEQRGNVPAAKSAADSTFVKDNKFVQFAMQNLDAAYSEGGVAAWLTIRNDFKAAIDAATLGQKSPKQALDDLAAQAEKAMAAK
jgi:multiple sugar transport system substrate-binding protein